MTDALAQELLVELRATRALQEQQLAELRAMRIRRRSNPEKKLLSKAQAARELGVDLKTTLADLLASKKLRAVPGPRGLRVPRTEIDRLVAEGFTVPRGARAKLPKPGKRTVAAPPDESPGDAIRALKL